MLTGVLAGALTGVLTGLFAGGIGVEVFCLALLAVP